MIIRATLLDFQQEATAVSLQNRGLLLNLPMGSGKTLVALNVARRRHNRGQVDRVLVVCQKTLIGQWHDFIIDLLPGAQVLQEARQDAEALAFYITSYERAREQLKLLRRGKFDMMIVDESHKIKRHSSKQSRRLWLISKSIDYRLALTGTPIEGSEIDFWAQFRYVDPELFGDSWGDFKEEWCQPSGFMGKKARLKPSKRGSFLRRVATRSFTVSDDEALGLPEAMDIPITVDLDMTHERLYRQMENDFILELPHMVVGAPLMVTQLMKLRQITGGFVFDEQHVPHPIGDVKVRAVSDLIEGHPKPIVIYATFIPEIEAIEAAITKLGRKVSIVTGKRKVGSIHNFDVLVCQIGIVAGLDGIQHVASDALFYSKDHSRIHYEQAKTRLRRRGQKSRVRFYHLRARNTVDIGLDGALKGKSDVTKAVVEFLLLQRRK